MDFLDYFGTFVEISILFPLLILIVRFKYLTFELKLISLFVFVTLIRNTSGVVADLMSYINHESFNNLFYYNVHNVVGTYTMLIVYYFLLKSRKWKALCLFLIFTFSIFVLLDLQTDSLTNLSTAKFNKYSYTVSNLCLIILVLSYLYEVLQNLSIEDIIRYPYFWISTGLILYSGGTLLMYLFLIGANKNLAKISWNINIVLSLLFNICLFFTFWFSNKLEKKNVI